MNETLEPWIADLFLYLIGTGVVLGFLSRGRRSPTFSRLVDPIDPVHQVEPLALIEPASANLIGSNSLADLQNQCQFLQAKLQQQQTQLKIDYRDTTFEQLQPLLTNLPTIRKIIDRNPDLPARNLIALLTPLDNWLQNWGIEAIGTPWEQVPYDPQLHQPDAEDYTPGEQVYIRFVGYRTSTQILYPAQVSRTLPPLLSS